MLLGGIIGGIVNYFFDPTPPVTSPKPADPPSASGSGASNPLGNTSKVDVTVSGSAAPGPPRPWQPYYIWRCIFVGIGASLLVPVFLFLTRSKLLDDLLETREFAAQSVTATRPDSNSATTDSVTTTKPAADTVNPAPAALANQTAASGNGEIKPGTLAGSYLVFFGLCVLVAISGFRFIPAITDRILQLEKKAEQAKAEAQQASAQAAASGEKVKQNAQKLVHNQQVTESQEAAIRLLINKTINAPVASVTESQLERAATLVNPQTVQRDQLIAERLALPDKFTDANDPQKGRWDGKPDSVHYQLRSTVKPLDKYGRYCEVTFWVDAKNPAQHPLRGDVVFFVHPTFGNSRIDVPVRDGRATLQLWAFGVFTAGAVTEDAEMMELDIADVVANDPLISDDFRNS